MPRDVKTGMLAGTVLCFVGVVWFCAKQQIVTSPLIKFESQSLTTSDLPDKPAPQPQAPKLDNAKESIIHTVAPGQTLSDISKIYYNTPYGWKKIYEANKEKLPQGPDTIRAGMQLIIPE
jgi:nucleoid-associated protein YgaU